MAEQVKTIYHWHAGQGLKTIVKSLGISRNTVRKYVSLAKQAGLRWDERLRAAIAGNCKNNKL